VTSAPPQPPGLLLVLSGPSGAGKTTITHAVEQRFGGLFSVSATTRRPGPNELHGRDYFFITEPEFQRWIDEDRFLEFAQVFGRSWYGTPRDPVDRELQSGRLVILDIDVQGAMQVRRRMPQAFMIFITAPNEEELRQRLIQRGRDDPASIERRLAEARREIEIARTEGVYNLFVVNDTLPRATEEVCHAVATRLGQAPAPGCHAPSR
jgi:guanylate kinase